MNILIIDNYDSFTFNLLDYCQQSGASCRLIRNDDYSIAEIKTFNFDAILLSPGPKKPSDSGLLMKIISYFHDKVPILGVCLGHQAIGEFFGAPLVKSTRPMHGMTSTIQIKTHPIFDRLPPKFEVMRYHSLILDHLTNTPLEVIAYTSDGEIMALSHPSLAIIGLQFHPESILTEYGLQMIQNWLMLVKRTLKNDRIINTFTK